MFRKVIASCDVIATYAGKESFNFKKTANPFDIPEKDGMVYVRVRAIASKVNNNFDGFERDELEKYYKTFIGKPVFVEHENSTPEYARGIIVDSVFHNDQPHAWIELLLEVDGEAYPLLAEGLRSGRINKVSMGTNVDHTICSVCGNIARSKNDYCNHIQNKGRFFKNDQGIDVLAYEINRGLDFFEISFVISPAEEWADVLDVYAEQTKSKLQKVASNLRKPKESIKCWGERTNHNPMKKVAKAQPVEMYETAEVIRPNFKIAQTRKDYIKVADLIVEIVQSGETDPERLTNLVARLFAAGNFDRGKFESYLRKYLDKTASKTAQESQGENKFNYQLRLILDNDEYYYDTIQEMAKASLEKSMDRSDAIYFLADELKEYIQEEVHLGENNDLLVDTMLGMFIDHVDWNELAETYVQWYEENESYNAPPEAKQKKMKKQTSEGDLIGRIDELAQRDYVTNVTDEEEVEEAPYNLYFIAGGAEENFFSFYDDGLAYEAFEIGKKVVDEWEKEEPLEEGDGVFLYDVFYGNMLDQYPDNRIGSNLSKNKEGNKVYKMSRKKMKKKAAIQPTEEQQKQIEQIIDEAIEYYKDDVNAEKINSLLDEAEIQTDESEEFYGGWDNESQGQHLKLVALDDYGQQLTDFQDYVVTEVFEKVFGHGEDEDAYEAELEVRDYLLDEMIEYIYEAFDQEVFDNWSDLVMKSNDNYHQYLMPFDGTIFAVRILTDKQYAEETGEEYIPIHPGQEKLFRKNKEGNKVYKMSRKKDGMAKKGKVSILKGTKDIVLAEWEHEDKTEYVTWKRSAKDKRKLTLGHYFTDLDEAKKDFKERIKVSEKKSLRKEAQSLDEDENTLSAPATPDTLTTPEGDEVDRKSLEPVEDKEDKTLDSFLDKLQSQVIDNLQNLIDEYKSEGGEEKEEEETILEEEKIDEELAMASGKKEMKKKAKEEEPGIPEGISMSKNILAKRLVRELVKRKAIDGEDEHAVFAKEIELMNETEDELMKRIAMIEMMPTEEGIPPKNAKVEKKRVPSLKTAIASDRAPIKINDESDPLNISQMFF